MMKCTLNVGLASVVAGPLLCTFVDVVQVRIACEGVSFAKDTMRVTPGRNRPPRSSPFLFNRRTGTPSTQALPVGHHIHRLHTTPAPIMQALRLTTVRRMMVAVLGLDKKTIVTIITKGPTNSPRINPPGIKRLGRIPATHHRRQNMRVDTNTGVRYTKSPLRAQIHMACMRRHQTPAASRPHLNTLQRIMERLHPTRTSRPPLKQLSPTRPRSVQQHLVVLTT